MKNGDRVLAFLKNETVLCIAAVLAVISAFIVKPDAARPCPSFQAAFLKSGLSVLFYIDVDNQ